MRPWRLLGVVALIAPLCACITHTHQENAALPQPWPQASPSLAAYAAPDQDYPSVGGDILKGSTPADLAAARAAAFKPLDAPDTSLKPQGKDPHPARPQNPPAQH